MEKRNYLFKRSGARSAWILLLSLLTLALLLAGCAQNVQGPAGGRWASISAARLERESAGEELPFEIAVDRELLEQGIPISIRVSGSVERGRLSVELRDPSGKVVWTPGTMSGEFQINTFVQPETVGTYRLGLVWNGPVTASYDLSYRAQKLTLAVLIPGLGMALVALGFIGYALVRKLGFGYLALGGLAWVVAVALKFAWAIPVNPPLFQGLTGALPSPVGELLFHLYVGALTGFFEVALVWLVLRYTRLGSVSWNKALAFGIGFGAIEALLLGLLSFTSSMSGLLAPNLIPPVTLAQLALANNVLYGLAPVAERLAVIFVHILTCVLLFHGVLSGQKRWFVAAFLYKTLLDSVASFAQIWGVDTLGHLWAIEAVMILFGLIGWWGLPRLAQRYPNKLTDSASTLDQGGVETHHPEPSQA